MPKEAVIAVIRSGGKQYVVAPGQKLKVEKLLVQEGGKVVFDEVLLVASGGDITVGAPTVSGAKVEAKVLQQGRGKKQIIFKMKPKKRYRVKTGHRQSFTEVEIQKISH